MKSVMICKFSMVTVMLAIGISSAADFVVSNQLEVQALSTTSAPPNYWCTWSTQGTTLCEVQKAGNAVFAGDQGAAKQRDNLNEAVLFGDDGWATLFYPNERRDLFLLLDAGWDLPYCTSTGDAKDLSKRGACFPHPDRFPSLKGSPGERLKALNDRVKALGWRGIGVWIPAHVYGDMADGRMLTDEETSAVLADKMRICKEAGVEYWKIDWGMRDKSAAFRRLISDVRDRVFPGLILEHCWVGSPLNDVDRKKGCAQTSNGRLFGNKEWQRLSKDHLTILAASNVFRTYDVIAPFQYVTTLERCAYYSTLADEGDLPVMLTIQEWPYIIGPGLGHVFEISPTTGSRNGKSIPNDACVALAWQKIAPPFGHDKGIKTFCSDESLEDVWTYSEKDCSWFSAAAGKTVKQGAPAVVTRGLPIPKVEAEGPKPFVCGARYPNGAIALAFLPRTLNGKKYVECLADVTLDVKLEKGKPLGVFGRFQSLTILGGLSGAARVQARQLPYGKERDVTSLCRIAEDGSVTIPMGIFETPLGDYTPNVVIEAVDVAKKDSAPYAATIASSDMEPSRRFDEVFADGARICFLGDSITAGAHWCRDVSDFLYTRFPDRRFMFVNAGVGGDKVKECMLRLEEDVYPCKPDVVTVMFGMNDSNRYGGFVTNPTPRQVKMRNAALDDFRNSLSELSETLSKSLPNTKICWFTPTPYDEFAKLNSPARPGRAESLKKCAEIVRCHASSRGDRICELHAPMSEYNAWERVANPSFATLCGTDRVHPGVEGGFFMAQAILKSWGAPSCVSDVTIDAGSGKCTAAENAIVSSVTVDMRRISFDVLEKSLPMPVAGDANSVAEKTSFYEELNREYLRVKNLEQGDWTLSIDGNDVMTASAAQWSEGVNLSVLSTPQSEQARRVSALNARRIAAENKIRRIAPARHFLRAHVGNVDDWEEVRRVVKSFEGRKGFPVRLLPEYVREWPLREGYLREAQRLEEEIYAANKPETHRYMLWRSRISR